ncbi:hypothetical protein [Tenacibaculum aquimarinum]|uniref:hypothetical protein n=1 Tax=Tenacibaculum aquimarinum TaxID=2910675 RepID=UPI001F0A57FF|nr:hypothetical protein [Tenacibaculum aquimarinum]MCH3884254.1 hypothetical protein [Tenacibaculum aquimarinum]
MKNQLKQNWKLFLIASLTLGLAPFNPPHFVGKLNWILGGNAFSGENTMQSKDLFDVFLHGTPWVLLLISGVLNISKKK